MRASKPSAERSARNAYYAARDASAALEALYSALASSAAAGDSRHAGGDAAYYATRDARNIDLAAIANEAISDGGAK